MSFPLYEAGREHDACGVGFIAHVKGEASHRIVEAGLAALERLEHRAATGAEENTGDGAGLLLQIPDRLFQRECALGRIEDPETKKPLTQLPVKGRYAVGLFFGSQQAEASALARLIFAMVVRQEGLRLLGFRRVPTDNRTLGATAKSVEPTMDHVFVAPPTKQMDEGSFERKLYVVRKRFQSTIKSTGIDDRLYFHVPSLSSKTLAYKGMLTPAQVRGYFLDLDDARTESAIAMFHSRFSTNTFPSWELAHPYRFIAHNGEINTLRGNVNWMRAREALLSSPLFGADLEKVLPVVREGLSDSACLDSVLELLVMAGRPLPHAVMMLLPEAWEHNASMSPELRAFYQYHACLVEPWDGPACVCFTDGTVAGAVLDRNGLRPGRYWVTDDDLVILASESGVADVAPERVIEKGRLMPNRMFLVDLAAGRILDDEEIKSRFAKANPYGAWLSEHLVPLESLARATDVPKITGDDLERRLVAFGTTEEELRLLVAPMATRGEEPTGSMGNDAALAVLSKRARPLSDYFQQLFAQVTNPPLDAIREKLVTSLSTAVGPEGNLLDPRPESARLVLCETPFFDNDEMSRFKRIAHFSEQAPFGVTVLDMTFPVADGVEGLEPALVSLFAKADNAIENGSKVLVLSDRELTAERAPIPALLAVAGLHNHLVRERERTRVTLIVETGWVREVHQAALLIGYGASAVNPYLVLDALPTLAKRGLAPHDLDEAELVRRYLSAIEKGVVKVMSKMGISTIASYRGAQIFEAIGLCKDLVDRYFTLTPSRIGGLGARDIAKDALEHHRAAFGAQRRPLLPIAGEYQFRVEGELHLFNPETVYLLQHATRTKKQAVFNAYSRAVNEQNEKRATLRSLFRFKADRPPVPLEEVEPIEAILPRFASGAMSFGSIGAEAHETLAIAMNRIGGKSNSGEGGEDPRRFVRDVNGDSRRSAIKQVASARFGVTSEYLVDADELQIKMAQGAKPGEGGQLPGNKVYPWIAAVRHATPGVGLISPPPHHDIYSIEDLAELIFDLRAANPRARISVKLVAEVGVGTVAAGVVKAKSDVVLISGHDGGTGASPLTSLKHAGVPWELGLAEAQQTLVKNGLRDRVVLQVDGQMKTGRDVVIAALLGAEEFGFATAPLVVMGCVMMRVCHLDTCPVGIATQNPALRERFTGQADHVVNFFRFVAEEVREIMAELGFRKLDDMVGRVDVLEAQTELEGREAKLDITGILDATHLASGAPTASRRDRASRPTSPLSLSDRADTSTPARQKRAGVEASSASTRSAPLVDRMAALARPAFERGERVLERLEVTNRDRAVGTRLGSELTQRFGAEGLPEDTIRFHLAGSAGQSLGAFLPAGITLVCEGDANDYVGKGLSGGRIAVRPPNGARFVAHENVIAGNVALYGATSGEAFFCGRVGERFAVRNSGAIAVAEGCGDHGCEYMTGGRVVILGTTGRNFAAGMSGGFAYVLDEDGRFRERHNAELVTLSRLDDEDAAWVRAVIEQHVEMTRSMRGQSLLATWAGTLARFSKVVPIEYERARRASGIAPAPTPPSGLVAAE